MKTFPDLDESYPVSEQQIETFWKEGFIKLKKVFLAETLSHYGAIITDCVKRFNLQNVPLEERDTYHKAFLQISNLWRRDKVVMEFSFSKRLAQIAAALLKTSGVRMYHDQALYKEPDGGFTPWHADQQYWPLASEKCVTAWVPLQETPLDMGPLTFAVGSHKTTFARNLPIGDESENQIEQGVKNLNLQHHVSAFDLGEISFHLGWTLHRAGPNITQKARAVMTVIYMDENMQLAAPENDYQNADQEAFCPDVSVGQIINTELTPVIWSK